MRTIGDIDFHNNDTTLTVWLKKIETKPMKYVSSSPAAIKEI